MLTDSQGHKDLDFRFRIRWQSWSKIGINKQLRTLKINRILECRKCCYIFVILWVTVNYFNLQILFRTVKVFPLNEFERRTLGSKSVYWPTWSQYKSKNYCWNKLSTKSAVCTVVQKAFRSVKYMWGVRLILKRQFDYELSLPTTYHLSLLYAFNFTMK